MFCPSCGKFCSEDAAFCPHCGTTTGLSPAPNLHPVAHKKGLGTASWEDMKQVIGFYGVLLGSSLFFGLLGWAKLGVTASLMDDAVFIAIVVGYLLSNWEKVRKAFRFRKPKARRLVEVALLCAAVVLFLQGYFWGIHYLGWPMANYTNKYIKAGWPLWAILGSIAVEPGVFEEIAFRGILQTKLSRILSVKEGLFIQAALFSILHLSPIIFVSHFVMGLLLGWVRLRMGHVYYGMLLHMSWNAYVVLQEMKLL